MTAELDFAMLTLDGHHSQYVDQGATTTPENADELTLGRLVMVFDRDGWATLHRVRARSYRAGRRSISFGPRVPWPDGTTAARKAA